MDHLLSREEAERLISVEIPNVEFEQVDIYLKGDLGLEAEVKLFDAEAIPNNLAIDINGIRYVNLFPLPMAQEMVEEFAGLSKGKFTSIEAEKKLLDYRVKDA
jgi:hypothetical protein